MEVIGVLFVSRVSEAMVVLLPLKVLPLNHFRLVYLVPARRLCGHWEGQLRVLIEIVQFEGLQYVLELQR